MKRYFIRAVALIVCSVLSLWGAVHAQAASIDVVSVSVPSPGRLVLGIRVPEAGVAPSLIDIQESTRNFVAYFLTGLALPADAFWVNLNPQQPDSVIDRRLQDTHVGRILLEGDLRLKKDAGMLTNPRICEAGKRYWQRLYAEADRLGIADQIPVINRVWIVPGELSFRQTADSLCIGQGILQVRIEPGYRGKTPEALSGKLALLQTRGMELMRELILPLLEMKVNHDPAYTELRSVYRALSLARWYKTHGAGSAGGLSAAQCARLLRECSAGVAAGKDRVYRAYLESLRSGEYDLTEQISSKLEMYLEVVTRRYFSGGIDFRSDMFVKNSNAAQPMVQPDYRVELRLSGVVSLRTLLDDLRLLRTDNAPGRQLPVLTVEDLPPLHRLSAPEAALRVEDVAVQRVMQKSL